jgi:hypothetical protein
MLLRKEASSFGSANARYVRSLSVEVGFRQFTGRVEKFALLTLNILCLSNSPDSTKGSIWSIPPLREKTTQIRQKAEQLQMHALMSACFSS